MSLEIERKFKVIADKLPELANGERFVQGYVADHPQVRFRLRGNHVVLSLKNEVSPGVRVELEFPRVDMDAEELRALKQMALDPPLVKTRYYIPHAGLTWEIDVYEKKNEGLIVCEVELPSVDHPIDFPAWVDQSHDITHDSRYSNINLTRHPYQEWKDRES